MGSKKRRPTAHEAGEAVPCGECLYGHRLLDRVRELRDQYGLNGHALLIGLLDSLQQENQLEKMWRRRPKKA